jgi:hypothetical protein
MYNPERVASGRGFTSLANEPSMFGFILTLLMASMLLARVDTRLDWLVYTGGMLLCGSASALICSLPLYATLISLRLAALVMTFTVIMTLGFFEFNFEDLVPPRLVSLIQKSGLDLLLMDHSINERVGHIAFIFTTPMHYLIGGTDDWGSSYLEFIALGSHPFFFGSDINNILSGIGAVIYDGGIVGIIYIILMMRLTRLSFNEITPRIVMIFLSCLFVAIQSVSFANPLLTLPLACYGFLKGRNIRSIRDVA